MAGCASTGEFMLFGVRVVVDSMRKSVSLNNLSQYEQPQESGTDNKNNNNGNKDDAPEAAVAGYASADDAVPQSASGSRSERKRGVPWTEDEHKLFLLGLQKVGKGDWRGISRNFVKTRTPTQVASHAQKYFLRRSNLNRRRRRSSLFDITTDTVSAIPMEEERTSPQANKNNASQSHPLTLPMKEAANSSIFPVTTTFSAMKTPAVLPVSIENPMDSLSLEGQGNLGVNPLANHVRSVPVVSAARASPLDLNLNVQSAMDPPPLSLNLSSPANQRESTTRHSAFQAMAGFSNGDSIISVA